MASEMQDQGYSEHKTTNECLYHLMTGWCCSPGRILEPINIMSMLTNRSNSQCLLVQSSLKSMVSQRVDS
jgi:hypothetical protein